MSRRVLFASLLGFREPSPPEAILGNIRQVWLDIENRGPIEHIDAGKIKSAEGDVYRYALSSRDGRMTEETARIVARLIVQLKRESSWTEFLRGPDSVFHVVSSSPDRQKESNSTV